MTTLLLLMPTETIPAPSNDNEPGWIAPDETELVVLPTAKRLSAAPLGVGADMMMLPAENPTDAAPLPAKESCVSVCVVDED